MRCQAPELVDVLPAEKQVVFLQNSLDLVFAKALADSAPVFVPDDAPRLIEHLPPALPGHVSQVGIFEVKGREKIVEAAELEELLAVECARPAAPVEAGKGILHRGINTVAHPHTAVLPPALRQ